MIKEDNLCPRSEFRDVRIEESNKKDNKKKHQGERKIKAFKCFLCVYMCVLREKFKQNLSKKKTYVRNKHWPDFEICTL